MSLDQMDRAPVAWMYENESGEQTFEFNPNGDSARWLIENGYTETPLYAHPPAPLQDREAVARCIAIVREVRDGFLSPDYATDQPVSSFSERFACDQVASAIENEFAMGTAEQRALLGAEEREES